MEAFNEQYFDNDQEKVLFYTGLPSFEVLKKTFVFVSPRVNRRSLLLSKFQEFILVFFKLRLNAPHQDLCLSLWRVENHCQPISSRVVDSNGHLLVAFDCMANS